MQMRLKRDAQLIQMSLFGRFFVLLLLQLANQKKQANIQSNPYETKLVVATFKYKIK